MADEMTEERIRQRAYAIWEQKGCPEGQEREHWEQACREIETDSGPAMRAYPSSDNSEQARSTISAESTALQSPSGQTGTADGSGDRARTPDAESSGHDVAGSGSRSPRQRGPAAGPINEGNFADSSEEAVERPTTRGLR